MKIHHISLFFRRHSPSGASRSFDASRRMELISGAPAVAAVQGSNPGFVGLIEADHTRRAANCRDKARSTGAKNGR